MGEKAGDEDGEPRLYLIASSSIFAGELECDSVLDRLVGLLNKGEGGDITNHTPALVKFQL